MDCLANGALREPHLLCPVAGPRSGIALRIPLGARPHRDEASRMNELLIGYARVSTYEQDLTAQRVALERLGVDPAYIFTDHGLTGTNRSRPGLREALAACRNGDTLVVAKLDRLARSLRDAKDI